MLCLLWQVDTWKLLMNGFIKRSIMHHPLAIQFTESHGVHLPKEVRILLVVRIPYIIP